MRRAPPLTCLGMALPRTFVSFSSTDISFYHLMWAWKAHDDIEFDFADFQLDESISCENPHYIKSVCRKKIRRADAFVLLIGDDTWRKTTFVKYEIEVAIEKGCRLIGVNLDQWRMRNPATCPEFFTDVDAVFVPFSSRIVGHAIENYQPPSPTENSNRIYKDSLYQRFGYTLDGNTAKQPPPPPPVFLRRRL